MAPIFKKVAKEYVDRAVFAKVDTNTQYELSSRYQIRSLPTFLVLVNGKVIQEAKGGIGEGPLRQLTDDAIRQAEYENVILDLESLTEWYATVDPNKTSDEVQAIHAKCSNKKLNNQCAGSTANTLLRKLRKKYKSVPSTQKLFDGSKSTSTTSSKQSNDKSSKPKSSSSSGSKNDNSKPNLHLATKEELLAEIESRLDAERDEQVEQEEDDSDDTELEENAHAWVRSDFPERVVIIGGMYAIYECSVVSFVNGMLTHSSFFLLSYFKLDTGGPAGMSAAIYAARAGLTPLVIAPAMGGQLQGKGVEVENYPGLHTEVTGPAIVSAMRQQAAQFGAVFEDDIVVQVNASTRPLQVITNTSQTTNKPIDTHTIIVATGAESNWLHIPGEWELRGGGVSSCATCDGFLYSGRNVLVVGGGDAAMEDALVLARTSQSVTLVHRRDAFRASKVLADRVLNHPLIDVQWNTTVSKIIGSSNSNNSNNKNEDDDDEDDETVVDMDDNTSMHVTGVILEDTQTKEQRQMDVDAVFVAIGHTPSTQFLQGVVDFDPHHPGYLLTVGKTTQTSVEGIFSAGDVSDAVYRQAITSAASGAAAALDAERYLSEHGLGNEAAELEAELLAELQSTTQANEQQETGYNAYEDAGGRMQGVKESIKAEL